MLIFNICRRGLMPQAYMPQEPQGTPKNKKVILTRKSYQFFSLDAQQKNRPPISSQKPRYSGKRRHTGLIGSNSIQITTLTACIPLKTQTVPLTYSLCFFGKKSNYPNLSYWVSSYLKLVYTQYPIIRNGLIRNGAEF